MTKLTDRQQRLLDNARIDGKLKVSAHSMYRRAADALVRRGLLRFESADNHLAHYTPTPPTGDDFHPVDGPTLATTHRQWLDRGLPARTWPAGR